MTSPDEVVCARVWLRPGSEERVREWAAHLNAHRSEALQALCNEEVTVESVFFEATPDGPCLVYYMRSSSQAKAVAAAQQSALAIDAYHQRFKHDTWTKVERLELLLDLHRQP